jgi:hypothetical protein
VLPAQKKYGSTGDIGTGAFVGFTKRQQGENNHREDNLMDLIQIYKSLKNNQIFNVF